MDETNSKWMEESLTLARIAASQDEVPVGALVVRGEEVVGRGYNRREQNQNPILHAEILALQEASQTLGTWRLNECTLIVTLEPCLMCLAASQQARIQKVIYGAPDPKGGALSLGYKMNEDTRLNHRFPALLHETSECSLILKKFFQKKRRT